MTACLSLNTSPAGIALINRHFHNLADRFGYLFTRWQDERGYEPWEDYAKAMADSLPPGFQFVKATKRPFGCQFRLDIEPGKLYAFKISDSCFLWGRLATVKKS